MSRDERALRGDPSHISRKMGDVGHPENLGHPENAGRTQNAGLSNVRGTILGWSSLFLAILESLCVAAVALSGVRVVLGMGSLIAATAAGPAHGFHREGLRVPILLASGLIALLNLLLLWNENRIRQNPSAQWRLQPLTPKQRRQRWMQLVTSIGALLLILAEVATHPWFHHEL